MKTFLAFAAFLLALTVPVAGSAASVADLFKKVSPSVVVIHTREGQVIGLEGERQSRSVESVGAGVLISDDGLIMTASHVVQTADYIVVEFQNGEEVGAQVIASEPSVDLALLKLKRVPDHATPAKLGDSDKVSVGDPVLVIGAPYGVSHTLTVGHISGRHTRESMTLAGPWGEFFQTDAAINPGNSGGPLLDMNGRVIGIVSHILSQSGGSEGLGFAVTVNSAKALLMDVRPFWTGVNGLVVSGKFARALNIPQGTGFLVQQVADNSPADLMGIKPGSIPVTIGGQNLLLGGDLIIEALGISLVNEKAYGLLKEKLNQLEKKDRLAVTVLRGGRQLELWTRVTD